MFQDNDSGEKIWRYYIPKIISTTTTADVKWTEKTDGGVARPLEEKITQGRPKRLYCGTCRMYVSEDSGGYFGGYSGSGREV